MRRLLAFVWVGMSAFGALSMVGSSDDELSLPLKDIQAEGSQTVQNIISNFNEQDIRDMNKPFDLTVMRNTINSKKDKLLREQNDEGLGQPLMSNDSVEDEGSSCCGCWGSFCYVVRKFFGKK